MTRIPTPAPKTGATASPRFFSTRTLLTLAAIGVAGAIVVTPSAWLARGLWVAAPMLYGLAVVPYVIPGVIAQSLVRRGGAALLVGVVAGVVAIPFTGGIGTLTLLLFVAVFQELTYLITRWRRWTTALAYLAAAVLTVAYAAYWAVTLNAEVFPGWVKAGAIALLAVTIFASTTLGLVISSGLRRAGVGR
ncbi:ECF transporter S component [Microbacterium sp. BWT-B31]|uniref:ECF transporter S component n=1 Tax=Microbacterium sp. BWT-B31 TaxID=3232072 RepID=UPI003528170A